MLIGIDAGNTNITVGLFDDAPGAHDPVHSWRFNTIPNETPDEIAAPIISHLWLKGIAPAALTHAVVASVVPALDYALRRMLQETFGIAGPVFVSHQTDSGLGFEYPNPAEVGADRIVNAAAALVLYGAPLIIIDFGTATTFCCISARGEYQGGQILPGVGIAMAALTEKAAKLSAVRVTRPQSPLGKTTAQGMVAGSYYQTVGAVEKIVSVLTAELGAKPLVLATGGFATLFRAATPAIDAIDPDLTLKGLKIIHDRLTR